MTEDTLMEATAIQKQIDDCLEYQKRAKSYQRIYIVRLDNGSFPIVLDKGDEAAILDCLWHLQEAKITILKKQLAQL